MLAPAAAGSVLELGGAVHPLGGLRFFILWKAFAFSCFSSGGCLLLTCDFCLDPDGPDKAQQFASHCGDDLSLLFSCRRQPQVALVQSMLRLPGYFLDGFRDPFLSLA
jgi:hypothetical protein